MDKETLTRATIDKELLQGLHGSLGHRTGGFSGTAVKSFALVQFFTQFLALGKDMGGVCNIRPPG